MRRLSVHALDPENGVDGQGIVISGGRFVVGDLSSGGGGIPDAQGRVLLGKVSLASAAGALTFGNLPASGYDHLMIDVVARSSDNDGVNPLRTLLVALNGDTANSSYLSSLWSPAESISDGGSGARYLGWVPTDYAEAGVASTIALTVSDYRGTSFHKVVSARSLPLLSSAGQRLGAVRWKNTNPVTSISLTLTAGNFKAGSTAWLYGIPA